MEYVNSDEVDMFDPIANYHIACYKVIPLKAA